MASGYDPGVFGEAGIGPEICRIHGWVPKGMELRFAFLVHIRRDRQYPWGLLDEVECKYCDGDKKWVKVSNDEELAIMFARHKEKKNFHVRLQIDVLEQAFGPRMAGAPSLAEPSHGNGISSQNSSVSAR
ncbi:hypothetical protein D1007_52947 [Hordeum vulgare]|nr:hypothetical protein D1007_52947 [Hordeum vulgare]